MVLPAFAGRRRPRRTERARGRSGEPRRLSDRRQGVRSTVVLPASMRFLSFGRPTLGRAPSVRNDGCGSLWRFGHRPCPRAVPPPVSSAIVTPSDPEHFRGSRDVSRTMSADTLPVRSADVCECPPLRADGVGPPVGRTSCLPLARSATSSFCEGLYRPRDPRRHGLSQ